MMVLFGGGDAGGVSIVGGHITRIPPNNPEVLKAPAAAKIYEAAQGIKQAALKKQAVQLAETIGAGVEA